MLDDVEGMEEDGNNGHSRGERVRQARKALGLSQEDLAHAAGVSVRTVSRIENNLGDVPNSIEAIAAVLGETPESLGYVSRGEREQDLLDQVRELRAQNDAMAASLERLERQADEIGGVIQRFLETFGSEVNEVVKESVDEALREFSRKLLKRLKG